MTENCDNCKHCKPDNSIISLFGLLQIRAMDYAKCSLKLYKSKTFTNKIPPEFGYCENNFGSKNCKFEAK